jgi:hypothetical protein
MSKARDIADLGSNDVIETSASGVDVTGTVTADGVEVDGLLHVDGSDNSNVAKFALTRTDSSWSVNNETNFRIYGDTGDTTSPSTKRFEIGTNGDVSFYEDTGTTAKFVWDASAESLGIGTSSPSQSLHVAGNGVIESSTSYDWSGVNGDVDGNLTVQYANSGGEGRGASLAFINDANLYSSRNPFTSGVIKSTKANANNNERGSNLKFYTHNNSSLFEAMSINSAGNVGIGTASPTGKFHIYGSDPAFRIQDSNGGNIQIGQWDSTTNRIEASGGNRDLFMVNYGTGAIRFGTNGANERARIDSSGNLLVGTTSITHQDGADTEGFSYINGGFMSVSRSIATPMYVNRQGNDGDIINFRKDGLTVGSIGATSTGGGSIIIGNDNSGIMFRGDLTGSAFIPANPATNSQVDNTLDIGHSAIRFDDIYATNGTIQTSDRNEKQDIETLNEAEQRVAQACKGLLRKFRWQDSVEEKGDDARIHFGIIAQDLQDAFTAEGLDAGQYAMFISATWTDEETGEERTRLGVRYPELLAFIISAL